MLFEIKTDGKSAAAIHGAALYNDAAQVKRAGFIRVRQRYVDRKLPLEDAVPNRPAAGGDYSAHLRVTILPSHRHPRPHPAVRELPTVVADEAAQSHVGVFPCFLYIDGTVADRKSVV